VICASAIRSFSDLEPPIATQQYLAIRGVKVVQLPTGWAKDSERMISYYRSDLLRIANQDQVSIERTILCACGALHFSN
jgi:hypothetical protein